MADNELRDLRVRCQLPVKDMVEVVRTLYPKFDKTVQSKCENGSAYGVSLRPDALEALYRAFDPDALESRSKPKKEKHRLTCRISARLEDDDYKALQQHLEADGYSTMQELLTDLVRRYLKEKEDVK